MSNALDRSETQNALLISSIESIIAQRSLIGTSLAESVELLHMSARPHEADTSNSHLVSAKSAILSRRLPPEHRQGSKRLQIASGPFQLKPDWWNVTLRSFVGSDEVMDPSLPWRWKDLLDLINAENFIQKLSVEDAIRFLANAGSALRVGGRIRLSTPSLEWVLKSHFDFSSKDLSNRLSNTLAINRAFYGWGHRFLYSMEMLHELCKQVGFEDIVFVGHGKSKIEDFRGIEKEPAGQRVKGFDSVWIVEAVRAERQPAVSVWADAWLRDAFVRYIQKEEGREA